MKNFVIIILFITLTGGLPAEILTLAGARELALSGNPQLLGAYHNQQAARWNMWNSALSLAPKANFTGNYSQYDPEFMGQADNYQGYGITVTQPLFNGGAFWLGYRMSRSQSEIAQANFIAQQLKTLSEVDSKYFNVLESRNLLVLAVKDLQSAELNLQIAETRHANGTIPRAELLQMRSQKSAREATLIQRQSLYRVSILDLANYLQISPDYELEELTPAGIAQEIEYLNQIDSLFLSALENELWQQVEQQNPQLQVLSQTEKISRHNLWLARGKFLPSLNISYSRNWEKYDYESDYSESERLMLTASLPLFPLLDNLSGLAQASHQHRQVNYETTAARDGIELGLKSIILNLLSTAKALEAAAISRDFARESYELTLERYRNQQISSGEMLDAEVALASAENHHITTFFNYLRMKSSLREISGELVEENLNAILFKYFQEVE